LSIIVILSLFSFNPGGSPLGIVERRAVDPAVGLHPALEK